MKKIIFNCYNCIQIDNQKVKYNNGDIVEMPSERADFFINRGVANLYIEPIEEEGPIEEESPIEEEGPIEEEKQIEKIIQPETIKKVINPKRTKK